MFESGGIILFFSHIRKAINSLYDSDITYILYNNMQIIASILYSCK